MAGYDDDDDDGLVWFGSDMELSLSFSISYVLGYSIHKLGATKMRSMRRLGSRFVIDCFSFSFSFSSFPLHSHIAWASFLVLMFLEIS